MKLKTEKVELQNPSLDDVIGQMRIAEEDARSSQPYGEFLVLDNEKGDCIQGFYKIKKKSVLPWAAQSGFEGWHVEKPISGMEQYFVECQAAEAQGIFERFLKGEDWKAISDWKHKLGGGGLKVKFF